MITRNNLIAVTALVIGFTLSGFKTDDAAKNRIITLAGIVVDAGTMQPIGMAEIDDAKGHRFGYTDKKGYYKIAFQYKKIGQLKFDLQIKKAGYKTLSQKAHWGDLPDGTCGFFYFGMQKRGSQAREFYFAGKNTTDRNALAYAPVWNGFVKVRDGRNIKPAKGK